MDDEHASARPRAGPVLDRVITVEQPADVGGADTAPTPTELFVASLTSCVAYYARRYLARYGISTDGLGITTRYEIGSHPARVRQLRIGIRLAYPLTGVTPSSRWRRTAPCMTASTSRHQCRSPLNPAMLHRLRPRSALA